MSITSKGKSWELLHSLWIGWTILTLGLFNWIAFVYIGIRAKQRKWILWGLLYSGPFLFSIFYGPEAPEWLVNLGVALELLLWAVSILHAFIARKEYLLRLEALQHRKGDSEALLKRQLADEYGEEERRDETSTPTPVPSATVQTAPERGQSLEAAHLTREPPSSAQTTQTRSDSPQRVQHAAASQVPVTKLTVAAPDIMSRDELEYQISSAYPFPLAFGFRSLASIVDPRDLYREQLRVAENMLAFLGSVSLALIREQDREKSGIDPKEFWATGISPGAWKEIVGRCSKVFASYEDEPLALAIKGANIRSEKKERSFGANITALIRAKNDFKHDRGPVVLEEIAEASVEVQDRLRRCMEALAFSTAYPLRQVEDFDVARRGSGVILKCLRYMGDHPSFPQEEVPFRQALPRGDLFLDLGQRGWTPLFPFMITMTCSHCKARETYFIDAWDTRRGTARMKSFERGHTMNSAEVSEALEEWASSARPSTP